MGDPERQLDPFCLRTQILWRPGLGTRTPLPRVGEGSSWLAQTPSYPEEWLSRGQDLLGGRQWPDALHNEAPGPSGDRQQGRDGQRPPCRSKQHSPPPPLPCRTSQPALPVVTQQVIDPGPEGHDLVRTDQLCQQEFALSLPLT